MRHLCCVVLVLAGTVVLAQSTAGNSVVIVLAQFAGFNNYELGTGAFIDHDGLIVTADHVVHHFSATTSFANTSVSGTNPTKLTVYSPFLNQAFQVDLNTPGSVVGGQFAPNRWIDAALIRIKLSDVQRAQIQPLDFNLTGPVQTQQLFAYGPKCNNATTSLSVAAGDSCLQTGVVPAVLSNDPAVSREYQIQAGTTVGYSGGPLVDQTGAIVGTASYGDVIGNTGVVARQVYLPGDYIVASLLSKGPPSVQWSGSNACGFAASIHTITIADWLELSTSWGGSTPTPSPEQCTCCCHSMDKMRTKYAPSQLAFQCGAPWACPAQGIYGLANAITVASSTDLAGAETDSLVSAFKANYNPALLSTLPSKKRKDVLSAAGRSLANLSVKLAGQNEKNSTAVGSLALSVLLDSQKVEESASDYDAMSEVFAAQKDDTNAVAADILSTTTGVDNPIKHQLHVDDKRWKSSITKGAQRLADLSNMESQEAAKP